MRKQTAVPKERFDPTDTVRASIKPQIQTARLSLNYRFGNGKTEPVDNSIPPVTSTWTAFYLGVAYITHATQGIYVYRFLNPSHGPILAAYIVGILVGSIIVFAIVSVISYIIIIIIIIIIIEI